MPDKQESRRVRRVTDSFVPEINSEKQLEAWARGSSSAVSRFQAIVRQDGLVAASHRAARKIGRKLIRSGLLSKPWIGANRCRYFSAARRNARSIRRLDQG